MDDNKLLKASRHSSSNNAVYRLGALALALFIGMVIMMGTRRSADDYSVTPLAMSEAEILQQRAALMIHHAAAPQILEPPIIDSLRPDPPDLDRARELELAHEKLLRETRMLEAQLSQRSSQIEEIRDECFKLVVP